MHSLWLRTFRRIFVPTRDHHLVELFPDIFFARHSPPALDFLHDLFVVVNVCVGHTSAGENLEHHNPKAPDVSFGARSKWR